MSWIHVSGVLSSIRWIWWKTSAPSLSRSCTRDTFTSSTSAGETSSSSLRSWDVHLHWLAIDSGMFLRFRMEQPVYINIIRDPINRFLSNYFFRRFGDWRGEQNHLIRTPRMKDDERYLVRVLLHSFLFRLLHPLCLFLYSQLWPFPTEVSRALREVHHLGSLLTSVALSMREAELLKIRNIQLTFLTITGLKWHTIRLDASHLFIYL